MQTSVDVWCILELKMIVCVSAWFDYSSVEQNKIPLTHSTHFSFVIQMFALLLRPKKDHKYRIYWNIYHHGIGYTILTLSLINVFRGFDILKPGAKWRDAYIIVIAVLGGIALLLEIMTWIVVIRRKKSTNHYDGNGNQPLAPWSNRSWPLIP